MEEVMDTQQKPDVVFVVGANEKTAMRFKANKFILGLQSEVFATMFNGNFTESEKNEIYIDDITPEAFYEILQFIYKRKKHVFKEPTVAHCADVLYAAHKYDVSDLLSLCIECLETRIVEIDNFWHFFKMTSIFDDLLKKHPKINEKISEFLKVHANSLITHSEFTRLDYASVLQFVQSALLDVNIDIIFENVLTWAKLSCSLVEKEDTPENLRKTMGEIINYIPFHKMNYEKFIGGPINSRILTSEEATLFTRLIETDYNLPLPWNVNLLKEFNDAKESNFEIEFIADVVNKYCNPFLWIVCNKKVFLNKVVFKAPVVNEMHLEMLFKVEQENKLIKQFELTGNPMNVNLALEAFTAYKLKIENANFQELSQNSGWYQHKNVNFFICSVKDVIDEKIFQSETYLKKIFEMENPEHEKSVIPLPEQVYYPICLKSISLHV